MKLRQQTPLKALVLAAAAGLFVFFLAVIKSDPRAKAQVPQPTAPAVDYERFFAPSRASVEPTSGPAAAPRPITRTRAS